MEGLLNLGLNASFWLAQVMYLLAEIKQLTQYMQSECFFNDFSIMSFTQSKNGIFCSALFEVRAGERNMRARNL